MSLGICFIKHNVSKTSFTVLLADISLIVKFTGLQAIAFGKGFVGFVLAVITLYATQFFVAGYSISWVAAIIGALIYGVIDYIIPGEQNP